MATRKNVLFIVADQLRADCLFGRLAPHVRLPHLTRLMGDAVTFRNHFTVTCPCGPARVSLLTGLYAMNHRSVRNGTPLDGTLTNIALEARKAGYDPLLFGYTDTTLDPRQFHPSDPQIASYERVMPGFNEIVEMHAEDSFPWRAYLNDREYDLPPFERFFYPVSTTAGVPAQLGDPAFYSAADSDTAFLTDRMISELSVRTDKDWFAHLTYIRPHHPFVAPAPYNAMYDSSEIPVPDRKKQRSDEEAVHPFFRALLKKTRLARYVDGLDDQIDDSNDDHIQIIRSQYLALASEVDTHVGRIIDHLKKTGQYDNTLLVFTSDHGEMLGDRYMWGKDTVYDPAFHVPLIIRDPDQPDQHGSVVEAFSESIDIAPTILDWMGQTPPGSIDGESLRPLLAGQTPDDWRDHVFFELDLADPEAETVWQRDMGLSIRDANLSVIRDERFKMVHFNGGYPPLLFDMSSADGEMRNLADDPEHAPTVLRFTQKMLNHRMHHANHTLSDMKVTGSGTLNYAPGS